MLETPTRVGALLPRGWSRHVRSAVVHAISMSNVVFTVTQSHAENLTPLTVTSWTKRLDDEGATGLIQLREPVNRFPEFVRYVVRELKVHCPPLGSRRIARLFARAGLHLGATTVRRMLRPATKPAPASVRRSILRVVTAKRPNHIWHADLTTVPTSLGYGVSWLPFALPLRWPFCWWVAVIVDHYSRRAMGATTFRRTLGVDITRFLGRDLEIGRSCG